jgi:hypothetical protein
MLKIFIEHFRDTEEPHLAGGACRLQCGVDLFHKAPVILRHDAMQIVDVDVVGTEIRETRFEALRQCRRC